MSIFYTGSDAQQQPSSPVLFVQQEAKSHFLFRSLEKEKGVSALFGRSKVALTQAKQMGLSTPSLRTISRCRSKVTLNRQLTIARRKIFNQLRSLIMGNRILSLSPALMRFLNPRQRRILLALIAYKKNIELAHVVYLQKMRDINIQKSKLMPSLQRVENNDLKELNRHQQTLASLKLKARDLWMGKGKD